MSKFAASCGAILIILASAFSAGCASRVVAIEMLHKPPCPGASGVAWAGPQESDHRSRLSDWCRSVGPAILRDRSMPPVEITESGLIVLTWNQHEDYGDLDKFLRLHVNRTPVIVLLQEVARASDSVPRDVPSTVRAPGRINPYPEMRQNIESIAAAFNLSLAYLPSMRNGMQNREDRGCAILSTFPISEVMGIELPWVSQRRVAVMATLTAVRNGIPWRLRVMSAHLDSRAGRSRQAAALADFLARQESPDLSTIIGADLNSWFGVRDGSVREIDRVVPRVGECGDHATFRFGGLRLDHLFTTLPQESRGGCTVERESFGSDHYPILLRLFK